LPILSILSVFNAHRSARIRGHEREPSEKVLVVEDEADVVEMLVRAFKRTAGFNVITAEDGAVGLRRAREELPVLVILDLMLPKMPGLEVCKILKGDTLTRHIPILMLTAKAEEIDRIVGWNWGPTIMFRNPSRRVR
jgi:DNA-binding response OmpR family regulator